MLPDGFEHVAPDLAAAALSLARRFAAGATMWVVAPQWPAHGRHVAVEFVHPVIVGKRALPTVHVDDADPVGALRLLARPGDVVLGLGPADDEPIAAVVRRADAWGLTTVWAGTGPRPAPGATDHVLWIDADAPPGVLERSGAFVLLYHVLWELTHVVFEHPGLLTDPAAEACEGDVCITCSDEGRVAEIAELDPDGGAVVRAGGHRETIDITLVAPVAPGDLVLVHAGTAITLVDPLPDPNPTTPPPEPTPPHAATPTGDPTTSREDANTATNEPNARTAANTSQPTTAHAGTGTATAKPTGDTSTSPSGTREPTTDADTGSEGTRAGNSEPNARTGETTTDTSTSPSGTGEPTTEAGTGRDGTAAGTSEPTTSGAGTGRDGTAAGTSEPTSEAGTGRDGTAAGSGGATGGTGASGAEAGP